ncbi:MAG TPA: endonuclease/exonuclease/phosphatase family protein [Polyangiaceae bacterium]|nr:endonuclease/exonuclease/phosphatase family protein [Polyangiaceae bacterium]
MTYNTHGCRGTDGRVDIDRVVRVVQEFKPDLLALQEVTVAGTGSSTVDQVAAIARGLAMTSHFTCTLERDAGNYGIAMLASNKLHIEREGCLPAERDEVRAAQWARLGVGEFEVDVLHTHLSVRRRERQAQVAALLGEHWLESHLLHPHLIVCGDLNALPLSRVYRTLRRVLQDAQCACPGRNLPTWPSWAPFARVDHVFLGRGFRVRQCSVPRNALTAVASDHLPLVVDLTVVG